MVPRADKIIAQAKQWLGVTEQPLGSNNGPELRHILRKTSFLPGDSWCMYFALACLIEAFEGAEHLPLSVMNTGSCQLAADFANGRHCLSEFPATGSIFVLPNNVGHYHHAGIVTMVDEVHAMVGTIEGNSNNAGMVEGTSVVRHSRRINTVKFIIWTEKELV